LARGFWQVLGVINSAAEDEAGSALIGVLATRSGKRAFSKADRAAGLEKAKGGGDPAVRVLWDKTGPEKG